MVTGSTATTLVYGSPHSTSSSNTGSPSSTPSSSGSSGSSGSTSSGSGSGSSGLGSAGSQGSGTSSGVVSGGGSNNPTPSSQGGSTAHCDRPGFPSCSSLGSEDGKNASGTNCPPGHSKAFCSAYNVAAGTSTTTTTTKPGSSTQKGNTSASSVGNNTTSSHQADAAHCDQPAYPSCYSMGFKDGKSNPGTKCPSDHSVNFCSGWNAAAGNPSTKTIPRFAKVTEIAPGAAPGPHTLEYIQAFNIAAGNPYKPGTKQFDDYQAGLDDAMKAGRDCDKMDTCGGPDLLGNYVNGVLHLDNKQYCGNGFGVYSNTLCSFQNGCTANIIGVVACPSPTRSGGGSSSTTTIVKYIGSPGLGIIQTASDRIVMLPSNASDFANNDPKTLTLDFVNPTGPDSIGNYYIEGEVINNGNSTLQSLKITAHWYDSMHKLIGVTFGYPDNVLQPLDSGKRATFTILGDGHSDLLGKPKFVELSYDWQ
ncbi:MAG: hypothetical protein FIO02_09070 [Nitrosopumilales archaeon]|nr:hypothetical protein [Nitrosopumilales archaeon]